MRPWSPEYEDAPDAPDDPLVTIGSTAGDWPAITDEDDTPDAQADGYTDDDRAALQAEMERAERRELPDLGMCWGCNKRIDPWMRVCEGCAERMRA